MSIHEERCFFAGHSPCSGRLVAGHLIPRALLKREYRYGAVLDGEQWRPLKRAEPVGDRSFRGLEDLVSDPRSWVPMCGGIMGNSGHHGRSFPDGFAIPIAREDLPAAVEEYAAELGLGWFLDRRYGLRFGPASSRLHA